MSQRITIRENDYYGGTLWVEQTKNAADDPTITVCWDMYGNYGDLAFTLTPEEAKRLAAALIVMADE